MAKTFGIPVSQRRAYRTTIPREPPLSLPPLATHRPLPGKKVPKTSEIIDAVNKEKWSFLQRLLAIEEKHEQKKLARQNNKDSSSKTKEQCVHEGLGSNPASSRRWMSDQILDDTAAEPAIDSEETLPPHTTDNNRSGNGDQSLLVSSLPNISQVFSNSNGHDTASNSNDSSISSSDILASHSLPREQSPIARAKRKRPLRLPPILLPPLYAMRPRPLQEREFLTPTRIRGPITDAEWDDLYNCRYIRHATPKYALQLSPSQSSFLT